MSGRPLTNADRRGSQKVMVISEALARAAFPGKDPIGRRIACCESGPDGKTPDFKVVVGVTGDVRSRGLGEAPSPEFYLPIDQVPAEGWDLIQRTVFIVVRTALDPLTMTKPLRDVARHRGAWRSAFSGADDGAEAAVLRRRRASIRCC